MLLESGDATALTCMYCGKTFTARVRCPAGHYICDDCHARDAVEVLRSYLTATSEKDPYVMVDTLLQHPAFKMYGPEHHVLVPAVLLTAARNNGCKKTDGQEITVKDLDESISRASKIPGGWCGFYGACGAGIGAGVAVSVLSKATPSTHAARSIANRATSKALSRVADDLEHCCKRSARIAIDVALDMLQEILGCAMRFSPAACPFSAKNPKCEKAACPFFVPHGP